MNKPCFDSEIPKSPLFSVVFEDQEILVLNKSAGLVCHPTKGDSYSSLIGRLRLYFGDTLVPHLINRLDRETSGLVVVAKTSATASILGRHWEQRAVEKTYRAIVHGVPSEKEGLIEAPLGRDVASAVAIKDCVRSDGTYAQTEYRCLAIGTRGAQRFSLLEVKPRTGRKHQIRIHLAHLGHPIVGDKLYGPDENLYLAFVKGILTQKQQQQLVVPNHALHAQSISFPWGGERRHFEVDPETGFNHFATDWVLA